MNIMLIEDNQLKADRVCAFLFETLKIADIMHLKSYQSGLKAIERNAPDLILLDMTLPTFDVEPGKREGRPRTLGGREIMRKLDRKGVSTSIIVVTQFGSFGEGEAAITYDVLMETCRNEFPALFCGGVYYHATSNEWEAELEALIGKLMK